MAQTLDNGAGQLRWTGRHPAAYLSPPGVKRHFCADCGTPMAYEAEAFAHEIHLCAASLDRPEACPSADAPCKAARPRDGP